MRKKPSEFITIEEANRKLFLAGMRLGFDLGCLGDRVAPMLVGKKDPKEIQEILEREIDDIFKKGEAKK